MVKKFLLSAAVVGALATSAMAYDYIPNSMVFDKTKNLANGIIKNSGNRGQALIYPAFFAQKGANANWSSTVNLINTSKKTVIAKVVLYRSDDSKEILDFNIALSPTDMWEAKIYTDENGHTHIVSNDESGVVNKVLEIKNPDGSVSYPQAGYIEIIGMAAQSLDAHGAPVTSAFTKAVAKIRNLKGDIQFDNGVPVSPIDAPYVNLAGTGYEEVPADALTGSVRVTDELNGKDMVMPAVGVDIYNDPKTAEGLVYLQGEAANMGDICITPISGQETATDKKSFVYNGDELAVSMINIANLKKTVFMTYGEAKPENMYALFTTPLKRLLFRGVDTVYGTTSAKLTQIKPDGLYFNGALLFKGPKGKDATQLDIRSNPLNFSYDVYTRIYNKDEVLAQDTYFSPATTPYITIGKELQSSGVAFSAHNLAYYLNQVMQKPSFANGGIVVLKNTVYDQYMPSIVTQMLATTAGSATVTNWITPISYSDYNRNK